jgi:uncharacterized protein YkwD
LTARTTAIHRPAKPLAAFLLSAVVALTGMTAVATAPEAQAAPKAATATLATSQKASAKSVSFTNKKRTARGIRKLKRVAHLDRVARTQALRMARAQRMFHNPRLSREVKNWAAVGENVAYNQTVRRANRALWHSPGHRANMLSRRYTQIGTGVAVDHKGVRWVVQVFRRPR